MTVTLGTIAVFVLILAVVLSALLTAQVKWEDSDFWTGFAICVVTCFSLSFAWMATYLLWASGLI